MKKIILAAVFAMTLTSFAHAQPMSSDIVLDGGIATPANTLNINLQKLVKGIAYHVTCSINAPASSKNDPAIVRITITSGMMGNITLNDVNVGYGSTQTALPPTTATLMINDLTAYADISVTTIQNADQQHEVIVNNCVAVANH